MAVGKGNLNLAIQIQADMKQALAQLQQLNREVANIKPTAQQAAQSMDGVNTSIAQMRGVVAGVATAFLSFKTAATLGRIADDYGQLASRLKMVTSSAQEYALVQQRIMEIADRTYKPLGEQQKLYIGIQKAMEEMGYKTQQNLDFLDSFSSSLTINSADSLGFARATEAASKAMTLGVLSGNEYRAVIQTMPTALGDIARYLGTTELAVKKMANEGKLSMQIFTDSMIAAQKRNAELAENMPTTIGDAVTKLQNHLTAYVGEVNEAIGATSAVSSAISSLASVFTTDFTADTIEVFSILSSVLNDIISHLGQSITFIGDMIATINNAVMSFTGLGAAVNLFGNSAKDKIGEVDTSLKNIPVNIKAFIQIAVVEIANFIEQARARVVSLANALAALPKGISAVKAAYAEGTKEIAQLEEARKASIQAILDERQAVLDNAAAHKKAYLASKDTTEAQTQATKELAKANEEAMQRAQAAAAKYGIALDDSSEALNKLMRSNKLSAGELTSQLNELEKKLSNEVQSAGKTAAQTLEQLGAAALKAAALAGASGEELDKLASQLKNIANMQKQVDQAKANEKAKAKAISDSNSLAKANESFVKSLEKQVDQLSKSKLALLEQEIAEKKLTGQLLQRAQASYEALKAAQQLENIKTNSNMQIEFLRLTGNDTEADLLELQTKFKETTEQLKKDGNEAGIEIAKKLFDAGQAKVQLDAVKAEIEKTFNNQSIQEQSIQAQVTAGQISQYEGQKRITELHKQTAAIVEGYLPALEKAAQMPGAMGEQSKQYLTDLQNQLLVLKTTTSELENAFRSGLQDGLQSSIDGLVKGTMDLKEAALNFINSIASSIFNLAAQNIAEQATNGLMSAFSGLGSFFGFGGDVATDQSDPQAAAITMASQEGALAMQMGIEQGGIMAAQTISAAVSSLGAMQASNQAGLFGNVAQNATEAVAAINTVTAAKTASDATVTASAASAAATTTATNTAAAAASTAAWAPAAATASTASFGSAAAIGLAALMAVMTAVKAFKDGGHVKGAGTGTSDSINAKLSNGEFVTRAAVIRQPGALAFANDFNMRGMAALKDYIPRVRHATGGLAGMPAPNMPAPAYMGVEPAENVNNNNTTLNNSQSFVFLRDPKEIPNAINSSSGREAIITVMKENPEEFKSALQLG